MFTFKTIVWAFTKAKKACDKRVSKLDKKHDKVKAKIYKQECKREEVRQEREKTSIFTNNLKKLLGEENV